MICRREPEGRLGESLGLLWHPVEELREAQEVCTARRRADAGS